MTDETKSHPFGARPMKKISSIASLLALGLCLPLGACDKSEPSTPAAPLEPGQAPAGGRTPPGATPAAPAQTPPAKPTPGAMKDDHSSDESHDLGTLTLGGWTVKAKQEGKIEAGKEGHFDIDLAGSSDKPAAVRVWIGSQDGKGSMKSKADGDGGEYHAHADAPSPLNAEAKLWIEIETSKGEKLVGSVAIKR